MWYLISAMDLERWLDEGRFLYLVDLRDRASYEEGHIRGAVNFPDEELWERRDELPKREWIVVYCYHGPNGMRMAQRLAKLGYRVADVYGGIAAYRGKYIVQSR